MEKKSLDELFDLMGGRTEGNAYWLVGYLWSAASDDTVAELADDLFVASERQLKMKA